MEGFITWKELFLAFVAAQARKPCKRSARDAVLTDQITGVHTTNYGVCGPVRSMPNSIAPVLQWRGALLNDSYVPQGFAG